jgi:hypothetical protein
MGALACGPRLGKPVVTHGDPTVLPIVHPSQDKWRWYVVLEHPIAGEHLWFVDTGFPTTTCDDDFITTLGIETTGRYRSRGEVGAVKATRATLGTLAVGTHAVELNCVVRDLDTTSSVSDSREVAVAGVLGIDVLRNFHTVFDPSTATLELSTPQPDAIVGDDVVTLRREFHFGRRVRLRIDVGDRHRWPVVDTGASHTHVDGRRLGLEPTRIREGVEIRGSGGSGSITRDLALYDVPTVALGPVATGPVTLTDRPRAGWIPGLLGLNVLAHFRQEYDFAHNRARFTPVSADEVPSYTRWRHGQRRTASSRAGPSALDERRSALPAVDVDEGPSGVEGSAVVGE